MSQGTEHSNLADATLSCETLRSEIKRIIENSDKLQDIHMNPILVPGNIFKPELRAYREYLEEHYPEGMERLRTELEDTECKK